MQASSNVVICVCVCVYMWVHYHYWNILSNFALYTLSSSPPPSSLSSPKYRSGIAFTLPTQQIRLLPVHIHTYVSTNTCLTLCEEQKRLLSPSCCWLCASVAFTPNLINCTRFCTYSSMKGFSNGSDIAWATNGWRGVYLHFSTRIPFNVFAHTYVCSSVWCLGESNATDFWHILLWLSVHLLPFASSSILLLAFTDESIYLQVSCNFLSSAYVCLYICMYVWLLSGVCSHQLLRCWFQDSSVRFSLQLMLANISNQ